MTIRSVELIQDLIERTHININQAKKFNSISTEKLNWRAEQDSWSVLECFEHLNLYGDFYIPEIKIKIESSKTQSKDNFKSGILGNYFAKSMLPKEKLNKMKNLFILIVIAFFASCSATSKLSKSAMSYNEGDDLIYEVSTKDDDGDDLNYEIELNINGVDYYVSYD